MITTGVMLRKDSLSVKEPQLRQLQEGTLFDVDAATRRGWYSRSTTCSNLPSDGRFFNMASRRVRRSKSRAGCDIAPMWRQWTRTFTSMLMEILQLKS